MQQKVESSALSVWKKRSCVNLNADKAKKLVLYKDDHLIAINKPTGLAVQGGGEKNDEKSDVISCLKYWQYDKPHPPGLAHRIDKNTTGVLMLTRTKKGARYMCESFDKRAIIKKYWAITVSVPGTSEGSITVPLGKKNVSTNKKRSLHRVILRTDKINEFSEELAGKRLYGRDVCLAWTKYSILSQYHQQCSLLDVQLVTGFKHQIRVHLADGLNCPVLGDYLFAGPLFRKDTSLVRKMKLIGEKRGYTRGPIYLHAYEVQIPGWGNKEEPLVIRAPLPEYFVKTLKSLQLEIPEKYKDLILERKK